MSTDTTIEWATKTWGPVLGCRKVSAGCDNCYAIRTSHRLAHLPHTKQLYNGLTEKTEHGLDWTGRVIVVDARLADPLRWKKPERIFVNSQSDLFHSDVPDDFIVRVFAIMALAQRHTFQILTKRPARMKYMLASPQFPRAVAEATMRFRDHSTGGYSGAATAGAAEERLRRDWPLSNIWLDVSVEDQRWADIRIPALLGTSAAVRWISAEPLLGPIDLRLLDAADGCTCGSPGGPSGHEAGCGSEPGLHWGISWVVAGGESGPGARPMHPNWARAIRDQCEAVGVPFLFKQWGAWSPVEPDVWQNRRETDWIIRPDGYHWPLAEPHGAADGLSEADIPTIRRVGKKAAGRLLDGRTHDEYPAAREEINR